LKFVLFGIPSIKTLTEKGRNIMKKGLTIATAVFTAAVLVFAITAFAQTETTTPPPRPSYGPGSCVWGYNSPLKLTEDQQKKLTDLMRKNVVEESKIRTDMQLKRIELMALYSADKPDLNKIDKTEDAIRDLRDKQYELKRKFRDSARKLLTKEQLEENPYAFCGRGFGMGGGYGMGPGFGGTKPGMRHGSKSGFGGKSGGSYYRW
jgi:Spy/CpxP family protein refolding chaperone